MNILHPNLLTPWQRFTVHWFGWEYARIWIPRMEGTEGWYSIVVRVHAGPAASLVPVITWTHYRRTHFNNEERTPFAHSVTGPARLLDLDHMMLTERTEP